MNSGLPKIIAFYLPQFHPTPENDSWWGSGFTEWYNVAKARPLFRGHRQPKLPGQLGFYDLRLAETRAAQANLARNHNVYGFCYWHYWFGGVRLLSDPIERVVASGTPDFPFCVAWANETWTGVWHGAPSRVLIEQRYPENDPDAHYACLRRLFKDPRYIKSEGKPLFYIYKPNQIPSAQEYVGRLRTLARQDGFPDLYVLGTWTPNPAGRFKDLTGVGLDAAVITNITGRDTDSRGHWLEAIRGRLARYIPSFGGPKRRRYVDALAHMLPSLKDLPFPAYNCVISNWDNTPRSGRRGLVLTASTPQLFKDAVIRALTNTLLKYPSRPEIQFVFLKSWNEWAEGNYVEPDQEFGNAYLESISAAMAELIATGTPGGSSAKTSDSVDAITSVVARYGG